jgi:hypothetical protein
MFFQCQPSPPNCGEGWEPIDDSSSSGEPHFITFDKVHYDFMGYGEYWLLRSKSASIQARQTGFPVTGYKYTWLKAVVIECGNTTFQVELDERQEYLNSFQVLLYRDKEPYSLTQNRKNVVLSSSMTASFGKKKASRFTLNVQCTTIAVNLSMQSWTVFDPNRMTMNIKVSTLCNGEEQMTGLLGNCNGNKDDEYITPGETSPVILPGASMSDIYHKFGEKWRITEDESMFVYPTANRSFKFFNEPPPDFEPMLEEPDPKTFPQEVQDACQSSIECYINYNASGLLEIALGAKEATEQLFADATVLQSPNNPRYCNLLPHIQNGMYKPDRRDFEVGERGNIACEANYTLVGLRSMVCPLHQKWRETPVAACYPSHLFNQHNTANATTLAQKGINGFAADKGSSTDAGEPSGNWTVVAPPSFISGVLFDLYQTIGRFHPDYNSPDGGDQQTTAAAEDA